MKIIATIFLGFFLTCTSLCSYANYNWGGYHSDSSKQDKKDVKGSEYFISDNAKRGSRSSNKKGKAKKAIKFIHSLHLHPHIEISPRDIAGNEKYRKELGTFCVYTDKKDRHIKLEITTGQGDFELKSLNGHRDTPYALEINRQKVRYGKMLNLKAVGQNDKYDCSYPEHIYFVMQPAQLKAIKAGSYDLSIYIQSIN